MASPSTMCASCLRAAQRAAARSSIRPTNALRNSSRAYSRATATFPSLYLDFLAPSAQTTRTFSTPIARSSGSLIIRSQWSSRRTLATTTEAPPAATTANAILHPRQDDSGKPMLISLSPRASHRLSAISSTDKNPNLALRITVESGGCHGFQYLMSLTDLSKEPPTEEDTLFEGDKGAKVVIDEASLELLNGSTVDYTMELIGSQFKVTGIPGATSSCGCGTSFDIKL